MEKNIINGLEFGLMPVIQTSNPNEAEFTVFVNPNPLARAGYHSFNSEFDAIERKKVMLRRHPQVEIIGNRIFLPKGEVSFGLIPYVTKVGESRPCWINAQLLCYSEEYETPWKHLQDLSFFYIKEPRNLTLGGFRTIENEGQLNQFFLNQFAEAVYSTHNEKPRFDIKAGQKIKLEVPLSYGRKKKRRKAKTEGKDFCWEIVQ